MKCMKCCCGEMTAYWNGVDWYLACDDCGEELYPTEDELKGVLAINPNGTRPETLEPCDNCLDLCGIDKFNQCGERVRP